MRITICKGYPLTMVDMLIDVPDAPVRGAETLYTTYSFHMTREQASKLGTLLLTLCDSENDPKWAIDERGDARNA